MTHHKILGVAADASPTDIKRAYRRLAMAWHPDRNGHPEAAERFKEIRSAYDALIRPVSTEEGMGGEDPAGPSAEPSATSPAKAGDIRLGLELTLEEAAGGVTRTIVVTRGQPCATCEGTGEAGIRRSRMCDHCHGSGRVRRRGHGLETCDGCGGRGFFSERICPDCGGLGRDEADVSLAVSVPSGMLDGDELRLAGQGEAARDDLQAGDLYLTIRLLPHALLRLEGRDLSYDMPVSALLLMGGGELCVPALGRELPVTIEPGIPEPRRQVLAGQGYPGRAGVAPGNLIVGLRPVFPSRLTAEQQALLREADRLLYAGTAEALPEVAAWRQRYRTI